MVKTRYEPYDEGPRTDVGSEVGPWRTVGGAVFPEQIELWIEEGLPARCPLCNAVLRFVWVPGDRWQCPSCKRHAVTMQDMMSSVDGGDVW